MKYRFRLSCADCAGDPLGCFEGGHNDSEEVFETPEQANDAGYRATMSCAPWEYVVIDEQGKPVEIEEEA